MIRREDMSPGAWAAMCVPINEVVPADTQKGRGALFIGSWFASVDEDLLKEHKITQLVSLTDGLLTSALPVAGRGLYKVEIADSPDADLEPHLDGVCTHITKMLKEGQNVLVHCQQGISRSSAVIIAYLMRERGINYDDALKMVREKRMCVKPNAGFEKTLREWTLEKKQ